jgi:flagellar hook-associated protein 1 FlgK
MSLTSILGISAQSLFNIETQIGITSQNIGNSSNQNYVQRNTQIVDTGSAAGVVDVSRQVNGALQQELLSQSTSNGGNTYLNQIYQQLEQLTGSAAGTPDLTTSMQGLVSAFQSFQAQPESQSAATGVIQAAEGLVSSVQTIANGIETIAGQVQTQAESDVGSLNTDLTQISQLNAQIIAGKATGASTANLEDQRDTLVTQVATLVPLNVTEAANGGLRLATPDGVTLVDGTNAAQFAYTPYTLGTNGTEGTDASITLAGQPSVSLNGSFGSGQIGSELKILRVDDAGAASSDPAVAPLEKVRRQLDSFVDQFYSSDSSTPTAFQSAYNTAASGSSTDLAANFFVVNGQGAGGNPQPAGSDRFGFTVNPALVDGSATVKAASGSSIVNALTQNSSSSALSAGDISNFSGTISALAAAITTAQTQRASSAQSSAQSSATSLSTVSTAYSNSTGVSMDQQLSALIVLQNAYNANAKVISVTNAITQTLTNLIQ